MEMEMGMDFSEAKTTVFWDVEDFPIPNDRSISESIKSALVKEGFHGEIVSIKAYGEKKPENLNLDDSGITFAPKRGKCERLKKMLFEIGLWSIPHEDIRSEPQNLMVIAKNIPEKTQFMYSLGTLQLWSRSCNVLLVLADDCDPYETPFPKCLPKVWFWGSLLNGGKALNLDILNCLIARFKPKPVKLLRPYEGERTADSLPCPQDFNPDGTCYYCHLFHVMFS